jgi:hypothetical protein
MFTITLRSEGGGHDPNDLIVVCGVHHTAIHDGRLIVDGDRAMGWTFRHADGTAYGSRAGGGRGRGGPAPQQVEVAVKVFRALCSLGFKQGDARRAIDELTRQTRTHVGADAGVDRMLRDAVRLLTPSRQPS